MPRGKVAWFDSEKGIGEILADLTNAVLFVQESAMQEESSLPLKAEQVVYFEILDGAHGKQAVEVRAAVGH